MSLPSLEYPLACLKLVTQVSLDEIYLGSVLLAWCIMDETSSTSVRHPFITAYTGCRNMLTLQIFNQAQSEALKSELDLFSDFLECRQVGLCRSEITKLSTQLEKSINTWFRTASGFGENDLRRCSTTSYILNCPQLHVIPSNVLEALVNQNGQQSQVSMFSLNDRLVSFSFETQMMV
jgi:hypothetical protein